MLAGKIWVENKRNWTCRE